jgi:hypothetical protein
MQLIENDRVTPACSLDFGLPGHPAAMLAWSPPSAPASRAALWMVVHSEWTKVQ